MLETHLRQAATVLLESAIRIAPEGARDWGQAMLGELSYVKGPWAVIMWALGGASVMARSTLLSILIPNRGGQNLVPDSGLFSKSFPLRKVALIICGVFVLGAMLFFLAPPFRQGARISLTAWRDFARTDEAQSQQNLLALARQAESNRDAEGMVFVAARLWNPTKSAQLAERAVQLDPSLTWIYAVAEAEGQAPLPEAAHWISDLKRWDPQNALVHLIEAESIHQDRLSRSSQGPPGKAERGLELESDPAWRNAMAAAFASPKYDDYLDRMRENDRKVIARYGFNNPYELVLGERIWLPPYTLADILSVSHSLLASGDELEARGDRNGARARYWMVARFGQAMDLNAHTGQVRMLGASLQSSAYVKLTALYGKEGAAIEAAHFSYLAAKFKPDEVVRSWTREERVFGWEVSVRNAAVLQIASLLFLFFTGVGAVAAVFLILRRRDARPRLNSIALGALLASSLGFLLSTATIYLTYRPYWYIFQHETLNGDRSHAGDLNDFLWAVHWGTGPQLFGLWAQDLPVYFWVGVILLSTFGLVLIVLRHILGRPRTATTA